MTITAGKVRGWGWNRKPFQDFKGTSLHHHPQQQQHPSSTFHIFCGLHWRCCCCFAVALFSCDCNIRHQVILLLSLSRLQHIHIPVPQQPHPPLTIGYAHRSSLSEMMMMTTIGICGMLNNMLMMTRNPLAGGERRDKTYLEFVSLNFVTATATKKSRKKENLYSRSPTCRHSRRCSHVMLSASLGWRHSGLLKIKKCT